MLGKSQEASKSPRLPQLFFCLVSACACSSQVQFQFLTLPLPVPLVFQAVSGESSGIRPCTSGLWFKLLTPQGGCSVYAVVSSLCPPKSAYPYPISSLLVLSDSLCIILTALVVMSLSARCQFVFSKSCSRYRYIFDMFMREGELSVLLFPHLDLLSVLTFYVTAWKKQFRNISHKIQVNKFT